MTQEELIELAILERMQQDWQRPMQEHEFQRLKELQDIRFSLSGKCPYLTGTMCDETCRKPYLKGGEIVIGVCKHYTKPNISAIEARENPDAYFIHFTNED